MPATCGANTAPRRNSTPWKRLRRASATTRPFSFSTETSHATALSKSSAAPFATSSGRTFFLNSSGMSKRIAFHSASAPANTRFVDVPSGNVASAFERRAILSPPRSHGTTTFPPTTYPTASISFLVELSSNDEITMNDERRRDSFSSASRRSSTPSDAEAALPSISEAAFSNESAAARGHSDGGVYSNFPPGASMRDPKSSHTGLRFLSR